MKSYGCSLGLVSPLFAATQFKAIDSLKGSFAHHPGDIKNKWVGGAPSENTRKSIDCYFTPPSPPLPPSSTLPTPSLLMSYCTLLFRYSYITNNKWVPFFRSLARSPPPPLSCSLSLLLSLALDERQALSRQWHSKTSAHGSRVSGCSTLLGAISLSKA